MGNARNFHNFLVVIDGVDHAIIADADAPFVRTAPEFLRALRSGIGAKRFDSWEDAVLDGSRKNSFSAFAFSATRYSGTQLASQDELGLDLFQRNIFFIPARLRDQNVLELLPEFRVLTQINLDRDPAAFLVGHVLNSGHSIPPKRFH
jgi:hypothetical protein